MAGHLLHEVLGIDPIGASEHKGIVADHDLAHYVFLVPEFVVDAPDMDPHLGGCVRDLGPLVSLSVKDRVTASVALLRTDARCSSLMSVAMDAGILGSSPPCSSSGADA